MGVNTEAWRHAAANMHGTIDSARIFGPDHNGYPEATRLWNGALSAEPALVVRCASVSDVQCAVRAARGAGLPISVKGGGHDWAGRAMHAGGLTIDLSGMRQVTVDAETRTATIGGGATAADLIAETSKYGLITATGTSSAVGMVGLSTGGGYGPGIGKYGLALDNMISVQVVLADGQVVTADATNEPDLFWAHRGGGGNFGVVTSMRMKLHPLETALAGFMMFSWNDAGQVWAGVERVLADAPDELSVDTGFVSAPDGSPAVLVSPTWVGDQATGEEYIARLSGLGTVLASQVGPVPWQVLIGFVDTVAPAGRHYALRTRSIAGFSDEVVEALIEAGDTRISPLSNIPIHCFRGAATRVGSDATAFELRTPHFMVEIIGSWTPEDTEADEHRRWVERTADALSPHAVPGGYVNLLGPDEIDRAAQSFGRNSALLRAVKQKYDPDGTFNAVPLPRG
jgi:FAD/FMN-containing dehydrogenase